MPGGVGGAEPRGSPLSRSLAHRVDSLRCEGSDTIGAKRTCRERRPKPGLWTANLFLDARRDEWIDNGAIITGE